VQKVAPVELHVSIEEPPDTTEVLLAEKESVGGVGSVAQFFVPVLVLVVPQLLV